MAKRYLVRLADDERPQLKTLLAKKRLAAQKRKRAQILLKADTSENGPGWLDTRIAEAFDVTVATVENVRKRCVLDGFDAAIERKKQCRPSRQRVLDGQKVARLVALCCSSEQVKPVAMHNTPAAITDHPVACLLRGAQQGYRAVSSQPQARVGKRVPGKFGW